MTDSPSEVETIGTATMEPDGTLVLDLRARAEDGTRGLSQLRYPPTHAQYDEILRHVGALEPGEQKAVPPWPE